MENACIKSVWQEKHIKILNRIVRIYLFHSLYDWCIGFGTYTELQLFARLQLIFNSFIFKKTHLIQFVAMKRVKLIRIQFDFVNCAKQYIVNCDIYHLILYVAGNELVL